MDTINYRLPDGRIVPIAAELAQQFDPDGAAGLSFTLAGGDIVIAVRADYQDPPPPAAPALPEPLPQQPDEPMAHYATRLFAWVLQTDVTATLSLEQLELAAHAGVAAAAARDLLPAYYARVSETRHRIARVIRHLQAPAAPAVLPESEPEHIIPGGRTAPLTTPPDTQPPAGDALQHATAGLRASLAGW